MSKEIEEFGKILQDLMKKYQQLIQIRKDELSNPKIWCTKQFACDRLSISLSTLDKMERNGIIRYHYINETLVRLRISDLDDLPQPKTG